VAWSLMNKLSPSSPLGSVPARRQAMALGRCISHLPCGVSVTTPNRAHRCYKKLMGSPTDPDCSAPRSRRSLMNQTNPPPRLVVCSPLKAWHRGRCTLSNPHSSAPSRLVSLHPPSCPPGSPLSPPPLDTAPQGAYDRLSLPQKTKRQSPSSASRTAGSLAYGHKTKKPPPPPNSFRTLAVGLPTSSPPGLPSGGGLRLLPHHSTRCREAPMIV